MAKNDIEKVTVTEGGLRGGEIVRWRWNGKIYKSKKEAEKAKNKGKVNTPTNPASSDTKKPPSKTVIVAKEGEAVSGPDFLEEAADGRRRGEPISGNEEARHALTVTDQGRLQEVNPFDTSELNPFALVNYNLPSVTLSPGFDMASHGEISIDGGGTFSMAQAWGRIHNMADSELAHIQQQMWEAGLYPMQQYEAGDSPTWGVLDPDTITAWRGIVNKAALNYNRGWGVQEAIDDARARNAPLLANLGAGKGGGIQTVQTSDPAALRELIDNTARETLGRRLPAKARDALVSALTSAEAAPQEQINAAQRSAQGGGTTATRGKIPQVEAQAAELAAKYGLSVTSTHRTPEKNAAVKGAKNSDHLSGLAADLAGDPAKMAELAAWARANMGPGKLFRWVGYGDPDHLDHVHLSYNSTAVAGIPGGGGVVEHTGGVGPTVRVTNVDTAAQAEERIREQNPVQAQAHDAAEKYGMFMEILRGA